MHCEIRSPLRAYERVLKLIVECLLTAVLASRLCTCSLITCVTVKKNLACRSPMHYEIRLHLRAYELNPNRRVMAAFEVVHHHAQVRHVLASLPKKTWQLATRSGEVPP